MVQQVVPGYPADSDGRVVAITNKYILENLTYDTNNFLVVADTANAEYEVKLAVAMPSDNDLTAAVTANVKCADTGPVNCANLQFVMTVTFKRLAAMAQTLLKAGDKGAADYDHDINLEHSLTNLSLEIAGAKDTDDDAAVSDIATRVKIEGGQLKRFGDGENQRLAIGNYEITVEAEALNSQTGFLGTLPVVITAEILDSVEPDSVVAAADREVILSVAVGHEGDSGHVITVNAGYALSSAAVNSADFNVFPIGNNYGIRFAQPMPNSEIEAVVTAEAGCTDDAASPAPDACAPTVLTITATFKPVSFDGVVQTELNANDDADYDHPVILPNAYTADAVLEVTGELTSRVTVRDKQLQPVDKDVIAERLGSGTHEIPVRVTHSGFTGSLTVTVTANIEGLLRADSVIPDRDLTARAVSGHFSESGHAGYLITVESGHALSDITPGEGVIALGGRGAGAGEVNILTVKLSTGLTDLTSAVVTASATCTNRACTPIEIVVTVQFIPLSAPAQSDLTVSEEQSAYNHEIAIPAGLATANATYRIVQVTREGDTSFANYAPSVQIVNGILNPASGGLLADGPNGTEYIVVVNVSHSDLLGGTFGNMTFTAHVGEPVNGLAVLAEADRAVDLDVAAGHFGDTDDAGHIIQFAQIAGVELSVSDLPANSAFQVVDKGTGRYEVRLAATMSVNIESLTVTATATCTPGGVRICVGSAAVIPVTVTFNRIANEVQADTTWTFDPDTNQVVALNLPSEYDHNSGNATGRTFNVAADNYPLPTNGAIPSNEASCLALGGRMVADVADGGATSQICLDYTFSNSKARTDGGGGCVLSGTAAGTQCAAAFAAVRTCNHDEGKPALDNSSCAAQACRSGTDAVGGKCPAFRLLCCERGRGSVGAQFDGYCERGRSGAGCAGRRGVYADGGDDARQPAGNLHAGGGGEGEQGDSSGQFWIGERIVRQY